jgi:RIP metalloprotease RseP
MTFLTTLLNIVVFLLGLSIVVCIHEAGHLMVAKICNVYCFEYSIGFGPVIFKHKFKHKKKKTNAELLTENLDVDDPLYKADAPKAKVEKVEGETQLSIRCLPLGGYVAMAGEDGNLAEDGTVIPKERCLNGVNHFKQICIMLAGITMNFLLAIILFSCAFLAPRQQNIYTGNTINLYYDSSEKSPAEKMGLQSGDKILTIYQTYDGLLEATDEHKKLETSLEFPVASERVTMTDYQKVKESSQNKNSLNYNDLEVSSISYASQDIFTNYWAYVDDDVKTFDLAQYDKEHGTNFSKYVAGPDSTRTFHITYQRGEEVFTATSDPIKTSQKTVNGKSVNSFGYLGITCLTTTYQASFGEACQSGVKQFGNLFVSLYQALGSIFTPSGWQNMGGIISVYRLSAQGTQSGSAYTFLTLWGYISLNLGCFNLLPFPGLDGWQTLIALLESISRKKFPSKVKNVANTVGMIVLFALAALLIFKDIFTGNLF